jgi:hypothetical protein
MKNILLLNLIVALILFISSQSLLAKDFKIGDLEISDPWARSTPGRATNGATYISKIQNHGKKMDRLIATTSSAAKRLQIHNTITENGIAKMRHVKAMDIHVRHTASLKPGGYHIMMMGLQKPLKAGDTFPLTLEFEKAGKVEIIVEVKKMGRATQMKMDHGEMMHKP